MHRDISYKGDNSDHRALNDLCQWFGFKRSLLIFREAQRISRIADESERNKALDGLCFAVEMAGVSGHPVRRLFAHFIGEDGLASWIKS